MTLGDSRRAVPRGAKAESLEAESLTPEEAAGQLVCVALRDFAGDAGAREAFLTDLARHGWGGIIAFGGDLGAVEDLLAEAQETSPIPLLATGDFERGFGQQFPRSATTFPSLMALGATEDPALARAVAVAMAHEMRASGFHVNFVPVADLADEPANPIVGTRAAGDEPERVAAIVAATVEGLQATRVAATVKHFPGHGRTTVDSHERLPVVEADRSALERSDLVSFRAGLGAGARLVMTAHVAYPSLEPDGARDRPATFSSAIVTGLLRDELDFQGLVCSDALMMGAVAGDAPESAALRALEAGVDWLLYPPDPARVHAGLAAALREGRLDRRRVDRALTRLFDLKRWAGAGEPPTARHGVDTAPLAEAVATAALTADPPEPPPGEGWTERAQWVVILDGAIGPDEVVLADALGPQAAGRMVVVDTSAETEAVRAAIGEVGRVAEGTSVACAVFSPIRAWKNRPGLSVLGREAVDAALSRAVESVLIVCSNPRIVLQVQAPSRTVWTYGEDGASQRAAIAFLRGARPASGRLPIRL